MTNLELLYCVKDSLVRCSACGTTLTAFVPPDSCPVCRLALLRDTVSETCPQCRSTRVLRTEAVDERGEQLRLCSHCNHIWSAGSI